MDGKWVDVFAELCKSKQSKFLIMPNNKKHHYVPRFYLKRFSGDGKSIGLYNLAKELKIPVANLKNQCYKNYFYGKEENIEDALRDIEGRASKLFSMIDKLKELPPQQSILHIFLVEYILIQNARTKYHVDAMGEMTDKLMKHLFRKKLESEIEGINLDDFVISVENESQQALNTTVQTFPFLLDLKLKLLINRTEEEFITSDNPVVLLNPFMSFQKIGSNTGVASKGLLIFFPIDSGKTIVLFDKDVYRIGNDMKTVIELIDYQDIYNINALQACSCYENIYFRNDNIDTKTLHRKVRPYLRTKKGTLEVFPGEDSRYRKSELLVHSTEDIRFNPKKSVMGIRRSAKLWRTSFRKLKERPAVVVRDNELFDDHVEFFDLVEKGEYSIGDFFKFLAKKYERSKST